MKKIAVIGYGGQGAWHCGQVLKSDVHAFYRNFCLVMGGKAE